MAKKTQKQAPPPAAAEMEDAVSRAAASVAGEVLPAEVQQLVEAGALVPASALPSASAPASVPQVGEGGGPAYLRDGLWEHSGVPLTPGQQQALQRPVSDDEVEIKPDSFGAVYLSHGGYRRRLIEAFGMGGWYLRPLDQPRYDEDRNVISWHYALIASGRTMGQAVGEQAYFPDGDMTYGDALEGAKSNALIRCCKDLGVALELWDRRTANAIRDRLGVRVFVKRRDKTTVAWRRWDDAPLYGETGATPDSPNRDRLGAGRPAERPAAQPEPATPAAPAPAPAAEPTLTEQQVEALKAEMSDIGVTPTQVRAWLKEKHGVEVASAKAIPARLFEAAMAFVAAQGE